MLVFWTVVVVAAVYLLIKYMSRKKYNLPPGPPGQPIIGNLLQLDQDAAHKTITKWSEKYGDIFSLNLIGHPTVVLNSYETIYEGLVKQSTIFAGRPDSYRIKLFVNNKPNLVSTSLNEEGMHMKKAAMQTLKMYGDNLHGLEVITMDLIDEMLEELKSNINEEPINLYPMYYRCTTGIISSILYAYKVEREKVDILMKIGDDSFKLLAPSGLGLILDAMPWLRFFKIDIYQKMCGISDAVNKWFNTEIQLRKTKREPGNPKCVLDGLLDHQELSRKKGGQTLSDDAIFGVTANFIFAGAVTTSITLNGLVAVLINKPQLQEKMAKMIKATLGGRKPCLADRKLLPYIDAAILEILRYSSIVPLNLAHETMKDTKVNGYDIPRGTTVLFNLWKLHHSEEYWDEPWEFKPERFLDENGEVVPVDHINRKRMLAFGASRRACIGEVLAKNRLFLMVTSLLQNFQFLPPGPTERPRHDPRDYEATFGIEPLKYRVKLTNRH